GLGRQDLELVELRLLCLLVGELLLLGLLLFCLLVGELLLLGLLLLLLLVLLLLFVLLGLRREQLLARLLPLLGLLLLVGGRRRLCGGVLALGVEEVLARRGHRGRELAAEARAGRAAREEPVG